MGLVNEFKRFAMSALMATVQLHRRAGVASTLGALVLIALPALTEAGEPCDFACRLHQANQASLAELVEAGLLDGVTAGRIAEALQRVSVEQAAPGAPRWSNYLDLERRLTALVGAEASRLHTGRSRQDLNETIRRMLARDQLLELLDEIARTRAAILDLADKGIDVVIPAYTHGVQAQPTTLAHYLLAFDAALQRDGERLREAYARLNLSPLGAAALGTSGYPLDRQRLASRLGFAAPVVNAFDANLVASMDYKVELASVFMACALQAGLFAQDLHAQYRHARPWLLVDSATTDVSSIMPQKRNPRSIDRLRSNASRLLADAQGVIFAAHNVNTGMNDYRDDDPLNGAVDEALQMLQAWRQLLAGLGIDREAARTVIDADYATMTEVADVLVREAGLPFRVAHHYASALTDVGRASGRTPIELSDAELEDVYRGMQGEALPVPVETVRLAMDPLTMIAGRRGLGGPQPAEVTRMLALARRSLESESAWRLAARSALAEADTRREAEFGRILGGGD